MIDFAGDVDRMFADPQGFGADAVYTPSGGSPMEVRIVPVLPDEIERFGDTRLSTETSEFLIPVSAVAEPVAGDAILYDGDLYRVQGQPQRDERRVMWRIEARPE